MSTYFTPWTYASKLGRVFPNMTVFIDLNPIPLDILYIISLSRPFAKAMFGLMENEKKKKIKKKQKK